MVKFKDLELGAIIKGKHPDGSPWIYLVDSSGPYARLSFCAYNGNDLAYAEENCVWLKDWGENQEIVEYLRIKAGILGNSLPR